MKTSDFNFDLPQELIAQDPLEDRSSSRLMVLNKDSSPYFPWHYRVSSSGRLSGYQRHKSYPSPSYRNKRRYRSPHWNSVIKKKRKWCLGNTCKTGQEMPSRCKSSLWKWRTESWNRWCIRRWKPSCTFWIWRNLWGSIRPPRSDASASIYHT